MAVTCDHRIRSLATTNKKTGFGSLVTTKCGHLRPQNVTFADRANKTSTVHAGCAVTCDQKLGSLGLIRITCTHARGGWGGWGGGMMTYLALAHILAEYITCTHARGGWGGWDDTVQRLGQLSLASPKIRQGMSFKGKHSLYLKGASFWVGAPVFCMLSTPLRDKWSASYKRTCPEF